ncbi:MAG: hypothetical protein IMY76_08595 [Chloroflexi bacterium]|nr:hypothetical protein [Chloroflexota bacterium]
MTSKPATKVLKTRGGAGEVCEAKLSIEETILPYHARAGVVIYAASPRRVMRPAKAKVGARVPRFTGDSTPRLAGRNIS